ncbi:uncharacterized protein N7443_003925 [Penicillium atrosanguineum]|uniref:uncharacterized protein n=1 Tax=Penicillium atrosanguineum TaxID=1132637 RepID=UPI00239043E2|nr:uncharacterized protein N7443_003925 [Penicillium atrosanguineum]KAJ5304265.1 hypothetical protein N7443_003925 [Penicillium atrosanguineum]
MDVTDCWVMLGGLYHAGGTNITASERRILQGMFFTPGYHRQEENTYLANSAEEVLAWAPAVQRAMGFELSSPNIGYVELKPPLQYMRGVEVDTFGDFDPSRETMTVSDKAQVLLVGCGGVGVIAALNLESSGRAAVTAVLRSNYSKVVSEGFHIQSCDHGKIHGWRPSKVVNQIPAPSETEFDYVVMTTKNTPDQPPTAAELIEPAVIPGKTTIVLIQNGLNIQKPFLDKYPNNICLSGVSLIGSHEIAPAVIEHEEADRLIVGAFRNSNLSIEKEDAKAQEFIKMYSDGGKTDCSFTSDVPFHRWRKLVYNACLNPICAITGLDTGRIRLADDTVETLLRPAMKELVAAAKAAGVLLPSGIEDWTINVDPLTMYFQPSMQEDVQKGNLVEFETLVGEPLREGLSRGVPMPTLTFLYHTLKAMQWRLKERRGLITIPEKGDYLKNGY